MESQLAVKRERGGGEKDREKGKGERNTQRESKL